MRIPKLEPYDEDAARRIARIIGQQSAAAKALRDLDERRARGEIAGLFRHNSTLVVLGINPPQKEIVDGNRKS